MYARMLVRSISENKRVDDKGTEKGELKFND